MSLAKRDLQWITFDEILQYYVNNFFHHIAGMKMIPAHHHKPRVVPDIVPTRQNVNEL